MCPEADGVGERADDSRERPAPVAQLSTCDCCNRNVKAHLVTCTDTGPSVCEDCRETCARLEPQWCLLEDHAADTCADCGASLCAELVSYDPGTGEQLAEARDYCAVCGSVPAMVPAAAAGRLAVGGTAAATYDFSPPVVIADSSEPF